MGRDHIVMISAGGPPWTGGRQYAINFIRALLTLPAAIRETCDISLLVGNEQEIEHYTELQPYLRVFGASESLQPRFSLPNRLYWKALRICGRSNPRLENYLDSIGATFVYPILTASPKHTNFRTAAWIPDFLFRHFPNGSNPTDNEGRKIDFARIARYAQTVVLSSRQAEKDCLELFPHTSGRTFIMRFRAFVPEDVLADTPNRTIQKYNLPARFFLVSNVLAPTKNHLLVLEALRVLKDRSLAVSVVFTGDIYDYRNPGYYNQFFSRIHELNVSELVLFLGLVPKRDQLEILRGSIGLIQPSLFEGWHTGVEEARLFGKSIVLSDIPVHREQNPPRAVFFDPNDAEALANAMSIAFADGGFDLDAERAARAAYSELQVRYAYDILGLSGGRVERYGDERLAQRALVH